MKLAAKSVHKSSTKVRLLAALAVPAIAGLVLSGCSSSTPSKKSTPDVTLSFSFLAPAAGVSPYQTIAQDYTKTHPNVTFKFQSVASDTYGQVLRTQLQAGNAPDVMYVEAGQGDTDSVLPFADAGYLQSLNGQPGAAIAKKFGAALYSAKGKVYAQPVDVTPAVVNINQTAYSALGLKVPTTLSQVYSNCAVAKNAGKSLFVFAGASSLNGSLTAMQFAATDVYRSQPDWDAQKTAGKVSFANTAGWTTVLKTIVNLNAKGCFQPGAAAAIITQSSPAVAAGTSLGSFSRGDSLPAMSQANPSNTYRSTAFPASSKAANTRLFVAPINSFAVNGKLKGATKQAALDFLAWMAQKKNADKYAGLSSNLSVQASAGDVPAQFGLIKNYVTSTKLSSALPYLTWPNPQIYADLGTGIQGLLTGQTTIPKLLASLDQAWG